MCVVSYVGDYWKDDFEDKWPNIYEKIITEPSPNTIDMNQFATKEDIAAIRREIEELKKLLKAAIKYDEATNQPHCEMEDKIDLIKKVAEMVGVDLSDLNLN